MLYEPNALIKKVFMRMDNIRSGLEEMKEDSGKKTGRYDCKLILWQKSKPIIHS